MLHPGHILCAPLRRLSSHTLMLIFNASLSRTGLPRRPHPGKRKMLNLSACRDAALLQVGIQIIRAESQLATYFITVNLPGAAEIVNRTDLDAEILGGLLGSQEVVIVCVHNIPILGKSSARTDPRIPRLSISYLLELLWVWKRCHLSSPKVSPHL